MNIAFVSYEYPQETGGGGIGTYLQQTVLLLEQAGHNSTVICATHGSNEFWENRNVYRFPAKNWKEFDDKLPSHFEKLHAINPFDVIEGTDFGSCGLRLKQEFPSLPLVVRLHTPLYLVDRLLFQPLSFLEKLRFSVGSLIRLKRPRLPEPPAANNYKSEFAIIEVADRVSSPGKSIYEKMIDLGFAVKGKTDFVPLSVRPAREIFEIEPRTSLDDRPRIGYIGRLEKRKGVIELAKAIPKVLKKYPHAEFTFIGKASQSPNRTLDMEQYLKLLLKKHVKNVRFTGPVPHNEVREYLNSIDIFVFPSHYESFGIACCEAMAAGKAVIGSKEGGMAEIINQECGRLVAPHSAEDIGKEVLNLIENDNLRLSLGKHARARILKDFSGEYVIPLQLACYRKAMNSVGKD